MGKIADMLPPSFGAAIAFAAIVAFIAVALGMGLSWAEQNPIAVIIMFAIVVAGIALAVRRKDDRNPV